MVGVIVLNYNNTKDIKLCVDSLIKWTDSDNFKLLIVDNGSESAVNEEVKSYVQELSPESSIFEYGTRCQLTKYNYLYLPQNVGYARGNNAGLEYFYADSDITEILILNSDIILTSDIVTPLVKRLYEIPDVGSVSPILYHPDGKIDHCCARKNYSKSDLTFSFPIMRVNHYRKRSRHNLILLQDIEWRKKTIIEIEVPSGSCMLLKKDTLKRIEGFDNGTFLYYEESILYKKLSMIGCRNYLVPSISCIHTGGATTSSTKNAYFLKKCNFESLLYYCKKYEDMQFWQMVHIYITASLVLARLWLGWKYHSIIHK